MARILVFDDEASLRATVAAMLKSGGHEIVLAIDAEDGVRHFREHRFDLVICDVFMPTKEKGLETIRALREISAAVPIISMTGSIAPAADGGQLDPDFLRMAGEFGATATIAKPFKVRELLAVVQTCLEIGTTTPSG